MRAIADALKQELRDLEYSEGYAESFLNSYVATQIKVLREQRGMSQPELAALIGTAQSGISRIENVNYSSWNIGTLKKLARAFNVRLSVSFEPYGTLPDEVESFSRESLQRPSRDTDPGLADIPAQESLVVNSLLSAYFVSGVDVAASYNLRATDIYTSIGTISGYLPWSDQAIPTETTEYASQNEMGIPLAMLAAQKEEERAAA